MKLNRKRFVADPNAPRLGEVPYVHETAKVRDSVLGSWTSIGPNSVIEQSRIGDYSYTAGDVQMLYSEVGKFCSIASHVRLNPSNHPIWRVTQHHCTYRRVQYGFGEEDDRDVFEWRERDRVRIGHDVWIGHNAIVMPGVNVGTGAVIGAGAVVTKDVEPYMIVVGVPAKPLRPRFPRVIADKLLEIAWWDWSRDELVERMVDFNDVEKFIRKYG